MIEKLIKAMDAAGVEAMAVSLPDAVVTEVTLPLLRAWNCQRVDVVGKGLYKAGAGTLSARRVPSEDGSDTQQIEVSYLHPLGSAIRKVFSAQKWDEGGQTFYLLTGKGIDASTAQQVLQNEKRLSLALKSGGYAVWDYNYETEETYNSPEMYDIFGHKVGEKNLNFASFDELIHPEDKDKTISEKIRKAPFGADVFQTRYRVKTSSGKYVWIESLAGVIRSPADGHPMKCIGLCRNIDEQMVALERLKVSERNFKRTQAAARLGSFALRNESGVSRLSQEMAALIGMAIFSNARASRGAGRRGSSGRGTR